MIGNRDRGGCLRPSWSPLLWIHEPGREVGSAASNTLCPPWTEIPRHDHREICVPRPGLYRKSRNDSWAAATTDWTGANWEQKKYSEIGLNLNTAACD